MSHKRVASFSSYFAYPTERPRLSTTLNDTSGYPAAKNSSQ
jgi:hypothetical protein